MVSLVQLSFSFCSLPVRRGLTSAHVLAEYVKERVGGGRMAWYRGELLAMAKDLGLRLLPAFNTTTGLPHDRVNLRFGINGEEFVASRETCTACAGTMILELAALSRLSGEPVFEVRL
jgi:mannosidase alpha-like ER degradation enhancer 3